ncbi:GNAT family N-acetyltransferase [Pyrococcus yayanosii]|uniref:Cetyltransferase, GNAT family n=1 Tax=Pyrococcus yayanosii (strain CH1 / JCM 16557) TaxID=529709 RepID=F8AI96_PYRYC|nr:GNAT family N-acetyltransferase [Pyrococcus yayanosii]AEH24333.1 cetyltransferase, GNAT family [Pyrococcus yayanosii CH1]
MIRIREAELWDCAKIVDVYISNEDVRSSSSLEAYLRVGPWARVETCAIHLNNLKLHGGLALVAELDGRVVGEAELLFSEEPWKGRIMRTAHLSVIEVAKKYQGRGIGRALVEHLIEKAQELGYEIMTVTPEKGAIGFYKRLGFEEELYRGVLVDIPTRPGRAPTVETMEPSWTGLKELPMVLGQFQSSYNHWFSEFVDRIADIDLMVYFESGKVGNSFYVFEGSYTDENAVTAYAWGGNTLEVLEGLLALAWERGFRTVRTTVEKVFMMNILNLGAEILGEVNILVRPLGEPLWIRGG